MNRKVISTINFRFQKTWWLLTSVLILSFLGSCLTNKNDVKTYCQEVYVYNHVTNEPIEGALIFQQSLSGSGFIQKAEIDTFITDATGIALVQSNQPVSVSSLGYVMPDLNLLPLGYLASCGQVNPIIEENNRYEIPMEMKQFLVVHVNVDSNSYPRYVSIRLNWVPEFCDEFESLFTNLELRKDGIFYPEHLRNNTLIFARPRNGVQEFVLELCRADGIQQLDCYNNVEDRKIIKFESDTTLFELKVSK